MENLRYIDITLCNQKNNNLQTRKACNLSPDGLLICGGNCGTIGTKYDVKFHPPGPLEKKQTQLAAIIIKNTLYGSLLEFTQLSTHDRDFLEQIIHPQWDGQNLLDGFLTSVAYAPVNDLAGWLKHTSLASNEYKRLCCNKLYRQPK